MFALQQSDNTLKLHISDVWFGVDTYHFKPIKVTETNLKEHGFTILETKHGVIVLNINHDGAQADYGNVYVSDY